MYRTTPCQCEKPTEPQAVQTPDKLYEISYMEVVIMRINNNLFFIFTFLIVLSSCFACANEKNNSSSEYAINFRTVDGSSALKITYINDKSISYSISGKILNGLRPSCNINGTANNNAVGDTEVDSDENYEMYPVDEFINDNDKCYISIRINAIDKKRVNINFVNCVQKDRASCPVKTMSFKRD
jgi:hypothetical protein